MKHDKNTFTCEKHEVDERQLDYTYRIGIEAFYEQVLYTLQENEKLHLRLQEEEGASDLHSGAVLAIQDAIKNLELIRAHFLDQAK